MGTADAETDAPGGPDTAPDVREAGAGGSGPTTASGRRLRWWRELAYIVAFYLVYSAIRNTFGSAGGSGRESAGIALEHARQIIDAQRVMGLWFEPELQRWYLDLPGKGGIRLWNIYYGTAHFVITVWGLVWLYRRDPDRYSVWRNTLAAMTASALIGFATYSLMPPRLLDDVSVFGACYQQPKGCTGESVVDTLAVHGGLWSFGSGAMAEVSNQYAAMPSLHTGWSTWSAAVMIPLVRRRWVKALLGLYPVVTVFCILITGNHYWLDAAGGLVVLGVGYVVGWSSAALVERRLAARESRRTAGSS